jgi:hypothetical protein
MLHRAAVGGYGIILGKKMGMPIRANNQLSTFDYQLSINQKEVDG